jgi:acetyl-CoA carboxylase carboxyl transferase subunit alpha
VSEWLDFERPVGALAKSAGEARVRGDLAEAVRLEERANRQLGDLYSRLTPWQRTQVARHPARPHFRDVAAALFTDFMPLGGDRRYGEDAAILGGPARLRGRPVLLIGHEKGNSTESRVAHNFAMPRPEGYRKAVRLLRLADRFRLPVISIVDTPGAFPGLDAEERGQAEAIAQATAACLALGVPMLSVVLGEGGSGGAIALAAANRVLMLEHAIYSVISPEGCAAILWRAGSGTQNRAADAAEAMKITAEDLLKLGVIDRIVYEPGGGAHRDPAETMKRIGAALVTELDQLSAMNELALRAQRRERFLRMGR